MCLDLQSIAFIDILLERVPFGLKASSYAVLWVQPTNSANQGRLRIRIWGTSMRVVFPFSVYNL